MPATVIPLSPRPARPVEAQPQPEPLPAAARHEISAAATLVLLLLALPWLLLIDMLPRGRR